MAAYRSPRAPAGELSATDARRMALRAQGLLGRSGRPRTVAGVLDRIGAIQLDTISVLARSHELVCEARLGPVGRPAIERGCWAPEGQPATTFEYWAHAACILPVTAWRGSPSAAAITASPTVGTSRPPTMCLPP